VVEKQREFEVSIQRVVGWNKNYARKSVLKFSSFLIFYTSLNLYMF